ncbi:hypothetical protein AVEN_258198-1 [Araneus ventricosus]|nr:hypothetical protein AVEN_258198-1 [Araneus ventricosus]
MAGRYKVTTCSIRNLIIEHFKDGKSVRTIGKLVKVSHLTVVAVIKRWELLGTVENALKSGAPHKLTPRNRSFIMHKIKKNPRLTSELEKRFAIKVNLKLLDELSDHMGTTIELPKENVSLKKEQESYV